MASSADWISQAEAARLRGVTRQAIAKLVKKGRLKSLEVGGRIFVDRAEVEGLVPRSAGRPSRPAAGTPGKVTQIKRLLNSCSEEQRRQVFEYLRAEFHIHPLEEKLNVQAEVLLEAISRASDLTLRGIRGVIAEAAFESFILNRLTGWEKESLTGDHPYDFLIRDSVGAVRIQVKMQRQEKQRPMVRDGLYVVETQRTRGGRDLRTGEDTRPYKYGEFDILAVSLHPSTNDWGSFLYAVADWLAPRRDRPEWMQVMQPVPQGPTGRWTDNLEASIAWFRSKREEPPPQPPKGNGGEDRPRTGHEREEQA